MRMMKKLLPSKKLFSLIISSFILLGSIEAKLVKAEETKKCDENQEKSMESKLTIRIEDPFDQIHEKLVPEINKPVVKGEPLVKTIEYGKIGNISISNITEQVKKITISSKNMNDIIFSEADIKNNSDIQEINILISEDYRKELSKLNHLDLVKVKVELEEGNKEYYFKMGKTFENYGFKMSNSVFGVWFPVGVSSIDLNSLAKKENYMKISASPISLAVGSKFNINESFYFGLSAIGNAISIENNSENIVNPKFEAGVLLDISSYIYVGLTYRMFSLYQPKDKNDNSNFLLNIGMGSGLADILSKKK